MSSSSDSEEFFDAEDLTPGRNTRKIREPKASVAASVTSDTTVQNTEVESTEGKEPVANNSINQGSSSEQINVPCSPDIDGNDAEKKALENEKRRKRFKELRKKMQTDEDDPGNVSPTDSQTSSVEGVFAASKTSHPFRIIDHDAISLQSMTSLGRVGRILGGMDGSALRENQVVASQNSSKENGSQNYIPGSGEQPMSRSESIISSGNSKEEIEIKIVAENAEPGVTLQEPDVIASTKSATATSTKHFETISENNVPIAPPRRKKKHKSQTAPSTLKASDVSEEPYTQTSPLPSPASTIESLTREFEHSLDIRSAIKGQYVVKPQDDDHSKAEGPTMEDLERERIERMKKADSEKSSQTSGSPRGSICSTNETGVINKISPRTTKERRKSLDDADEIMTQLNMVVRTRTDSGKQLTDLEILEQVTVLNLDTGERVPLSVAEDKLPQCINPLSLHIMRLTSEYVSNSSLEKEKESDEESVDLKKSSVAPCEDTDVSVVKKRTSQLKKFLGHTVKKTMDKAKSIAQEVSHARHKEDVMDIVDEVSPGEQILKLKASGSHKGPYEFDNLQHVQDLSGEHVGAVWCMKFSSCGRLLATAGQDRVLRVWVLRDAYVYFQDMRTKYNAEKVSPTPSQESLVSQHSSEDPMAMMCCDQRDDAAKTPFMPKPFCTYSGHTSDLLDVAWSKNYFILSSSMDKTVRLWHISRKECLCCFQHIDFVTAIVFHPRDDRYFLSGSLDGKLRLWNIPDKKVAVWTEVEGQTKLITAANFCQNGKFAVVGSYDGRCIFYTTEQLKYHTQIHVRSTRGKNSKGRKISGIEPMPGEDKILVTSNDSRIRLYDLRDLNLSCKYKGYVNVSSQIKASFSHDGKYIISGSENQCIYIWKTHHDYAKFSSVRRDRNDFWEGIKAHNAVVTCAVFAPNPDIFIRQMEKEKEKDKPPIEDPLVAQHTNGCGGYVLISADFNGSIKVFLNKTKPKHSSLPASALA